MSCKYYFLGALGLVLFNDTLIKKTFQNVALLSIKEANTRRKIQQMKINKVDEGL